MTKDPKISNIQLMGMLVSSIVGIGIFKLPNQLVGDFGCCGWVIIIISGLLVLPILFAYGKLFSMYPDMDFFQIGKEVLGSILFNIYLLLLLGYFIILLGFVSRNLGEMIKSFLLIRTPIEVIILVFILSTSYIACYEIDVIGRAGFIVYPIIVAFIIIIVLISIPNADFTNLLPVFQFHIKDIPRGINTSFFSYIGFEVCLFAIPYLEDRKDSFKFTSIGLVTVILMYLSVYIMTIAQFSIRQVERQTWPVLTLVKIVDLPGYFLENLDGLIMSTWVLVIFATMAPIYFGAGKILSKMFKTKSHKYFIWVLIPIIYFTSLFPENHIQINERMGGYLNILGAITIVILPFLILLIGSIKRSIQR